MIKRIVIYVVFAVLLFNLSYNVHLLALVEPSTSSPYDLKSIYLFHAIGSLLIVVLAEVLYKVAIELRDQLGFIYLGTTALKVLLFFIVFSNILFLSASISKTDKIHLLIPMIIFMIFEVIIVVKILNRSVKN